MYIFKPKDRQLAEFARNCHQVFVPDDVSYEDALKEEAWSNLAIELRPLDRIELESESGRFSALLQVKQVGAGFVRFNELFKVDLEADRVEEDKDFRIKFINNRYKWGVERISDGFKMIQELETESDALQWLADHRKAMGRAA